jgi:hypothetical protein
VQQPIITERAGAGASMSPAGIIITGGDDASYTTLSSTEVMTGEGWVAGPDMPVAVRRHCQVTVGSRVYVAGRTGVLSIISINIINMYRWLDC